MLLFKQCVNLVSVSLSANLSSSHSSIIRITCFDPDPRIKPCILYYCTILKKIHLPKLLKQELEKKYYDTQAQERNTHTTCFGKTKLKHSPDKKYKINLDQHPPPTSLLLGFHHPNFKHLL